MSELVDRLRRAAAPDFNDPDDVSALMRTAADRIEYLESVAGAVSQAPPDAIEKLRGLRKTSGPRDA